MSRSESSAAKIAANIANSKKSTGPRTAEGKEKVSRNARKHGFTCARLYVPAGMESLLAEIEAEYRAAIHPEGLLEEDLFLQLRNARFNMERAQLLMDDLGLASDTELDPLADPELRKDYLIYHRYFAQAQSTFLRMLNELRKLQTERALRRQLPAEEHTQIPALSSSPALLRLARRQFQGTPVHPAGPTLPGLTNPTFSGGFGTKPNQPAA